MKTAQHYNKRFRGIPNTIYRKLTIRYFRYLETKYTLVIADRSCRCICLTTLQPTDGYGCCEEASNYFIQFKDVGKTVCDYGYDATLWKVEVPEGAVIDRKDDGFKSSSITLSDSQVIYSNYSLTKQIVKQTVWP